MDLRKFIRETLNETYGPSVVQYSAVVIEDPTEEQKIKDLAAQYVPSEGWREPAHYHMTIGQGPIPQSLELKGDLNKEVELTINMIGISENAIAFGTFGYYSKNDMPHITVAFNKKYGAAPADSKEIKDWKKINPIKVVGVVREIGTGNQILKESIEDKIKADFSTMHIMLGNEIVGDFYVDRQGENYLILHKIEIYKKYRGMGYASEAMRQIIDYADKNNLIIALTPDSYRGSNVNRLIKWYKSFGFVMNKGKKKDFSHMQLMYKLPSSLDETLEYVGKVTTTSRNAHAGIPAEFPQENDFDQFGNMRNDLAR